MQNYFNSCVSDNGFGNLNFDLNDVEGLFIGASPANALNNEPEENDLTDEQIATVVENCENELGSLKQSKVFFESCLDCLLYTSDAADERSSVDLGGRRMCVLHHS